MTRPGRAIFIKCISMRGGRMEYLMNYCYRLNLNVVYYLLNTWEMGVRQSQSDGIWLRHNKITLAFEQNGPYPTCKLKWTILFIFNNIGLAWTKMRSSKIISQDNWPHQIQIGLRTLSLRLTNMVLLGAWNHLWYWVSNECLLFSTNFQNDQK